VAVPFVPPAVRRGLARRALNIRAQLFRFPVARALFGLVVGFGAAGVTFLAVDRFGTDDNDETTVVLHDDLDYDGFCATVRDGGRALRVSDDAEGWRCGGFVNGMWSPAILDFAALCRWQHGDTAVPRSNESDGAFSIVCIVPN